MSHHCIKEQKINEIKDKCENLNIKQLNEVLKSFKKYEPQKLDDYVREYARENIIMPNETEIESVGRALGTEVRSLCLELGHNLCKLKSDKNYAEHWADLYVEEKGYKNGIELDMWISERVPLFDVCVLAKIIHKLYTKEIVFR